MEKQLKVHLLEDTEKELVETLKKQLSSKIKLSFGAIDKSKADFEILVAGVPAVEDLSASKNLKRLIIPWAGLPRRTAEYMEQFPNVKINNLHYNAPIVAENAITLMLAVTKKIIVIDRAFRRHDWRNRYLPLNPQLLDGKRVTLLGYGAIGQQIEKRLNGWEMRIRRVSRTAREGISAITELDTILKTTDLLFITLPHTSTTNGLLNKKRLAALPDNATLINLSRGPVIEEQALYDELKSGRIKAGIDVWYNYPKDKEEQKNCPPSQFNFDELDNVVMTPHMAGHSDRSDELLIEDLARLLNELADGKTDRNRVSLEHGY